jgi:hypothetical protein
VAGPLARSASDLKIALMVPTRSCGISSRLIERAWRRYWLNASLISSTSFMLMVCPGAMACTLMWYSPSSRASVLVNPITPAFEVT